MREAAERRDVFLRSRGGTPDSARAACAHLSRDASGDFAEHRAHGRDQLWRLAARRHAFEPALVDDAAPRAQVAKGPVPFEPDAARLVSLEGGQLELDLQGALL